MDAPNRKLYAEPCLWQLLTKTEGKAQSLEGDYTEQKDPRKVDGLVFSPDAKAAECLQDSDWGNLPSALPVTTHRVIKTENTKVKGQILFLFCLLQNIKQSSMCYTVGSCWLSKKQYAF